MGGQRHAPVALPPGKENPYQLHSRLGGSQCRSGEVRKISSPPGFDAGTAQPVASRYTDCAIPAYTQFRNPLLSVRNSVQNILMLFHINGCTWHTWQLVPHTHTHTHMYMYVCVYIYIYIYMCVCVCVCMYTHTYIRCASCSEGWGFSYRIWAILSPIYVITYKRGYTAV
jgi:hypothetical protein